MILTCSSCSTRYLIDPASVGAEGRTVKCAKCGHKWREYPPADLPKQVVEESTSAPESSADAGAMSIEEMTAAAPRTPPPELEKKKRSWLGWLIFILLLAGILAGGFYGKQYVVNFWPASAKLYQMLKLDVKTENKLGLEIKDLNTVQVQENGVVRLTVSGTIVNLSGTVRPIPRIGIQLMDSDGHHVYSWSTTAEKETVEPWASVGFSSSVSQPPKDARHAKADLIPPKVNTDTHSEAPEAEKTH